MKRSIRIIITFAVLLIGVPFLPLYIERTMLRSWRVDRLGDEITWGWKLCSLIDYWNNYHYQTSYQNPGFWLKVNIALAILYALVLTLVIDQVWKMISRRRMRSPGFGVR